MESLAKDSGDSDGGRAGHDRVGPDHGSDHGGWWELGLAYQRRLLWYASVELLGLVADHFHHLCPISVAFWQRCKTRPARVRPASAGELLSWSPHWGLWLPRWLPAQAAWL